MQEVIEETHAVTFIKVPSTYPSLYPSTYPSTYPSLYPSTYPSLYLHMYICGELDDVKRFGSIIYNNDIL